MDPLIERMHSDSDAACGRGFSGVRTTIKFVGEAGSQRGNQMSTCTVLAGPVVYRNLGETYSKGEHWMEIFSAVGERRVYCTHLAHSFCCTASAVFLLHAAVRQT